MYCIKYSDSLLNVFLLRKIPVIPEKWWRKKEEKENSGILQIFYALRLTFKLALSFSRRIKLHQHLTKLINLAKINISPSHEKREKIKTLHSFWIENISVIVFFFARQIFISATDFRSWSKSKNRWNVTCNAIRVSWAGNDTPNNPFHGCVDLLIESKCINHKGW